MNIVKELRKLLRFRVLIVRLWGGGGRGRKLQIKFDNFFEFECPAVGGEGVCKWQKFENFFDFGCYWGGRRRRHGNSYHPHRNL